ncbi:hypothetical protein, unlikely [Trypanosoma brucei gambiense DAL972]|uniref:T. brucei spp.-specific protein n=1 Tax=Trypanosoma brucei gambiense (strain MHOM/CI/86/DAL972) TaxID=679716 RepID=D0A3B3_TRYB9|nr:hypothetical protein, unlikely [Trypanosoma brucei gambiense DAL972]CBH15757.1 hypothetical protein, unlikely [Trypanosoma brucei gambiense DAL972]|eukprot:XP_011778021.1 hypothetical protein, unlikely [Trypanosoma brucei gambiense DAL972]
MDFGGDRYARERICNPLLLFVFVFVLFYRTHGESGMAAFYTPRCVKTICRPEQLCGAKSCSSPMTVGRRTHGCKSVTRFVYRGGVDGRTTAACLRPFASLCMLGWA